MGRWPSPLLRCASIVFTSSKIIHYIKRDVRNRSSAFITGSVRSVTRAFRESRCPSPTAGCWSWSSYNCRNTWQSCGRRPRIFSTTFFAKVDLPSSAESACSYFTRNSSRSLETLLTSSRDLFNDVGEENTAPEIYASVSAVFCWNNTRWKAR